MFLFFIYLLIFLYWTEVEETHSHGACGTCLSYAASDVRVSFCACILHFKTSALNTMLCILPPRASGKCLDPSFSSLSPLGPLRRGLIATSRLSLALHRKQHFWDGGSTWEGHPGICHVWLCLRSQSPRICMLPVPLLPARQPCCHVALDRRCSAPDPLSGRKCN